MTIGAKVRLTHRKNKHFCKLGEGHKMGSESNQPSISDQTIIFMHKPTGEIYVSKLSVSKESENSVTCRIVFDAQVLRSIVTLGSIGEVTKKECLILPQSLEEMGEVCFCEMEELMDVDLRLSNVWRIGEGAFYSCDKLSRLRLPTNLREVGNSSFELDESLCNVELGHTRLRVIGEFCFYGDSGLKKVSLPATLETIGESAFCGASLIELRLSHCERLRVVGNATFSECRTLKMLALPSHSFSMPCSVFLSAPWPLNVSISLPLLRKVDLIGSGDTAPYDICVLIAAEVRCFDVGVQMDEWGSLLRRADKSLSEASIFVLKKTVPLPPPM
jgi:hypothetical protein